MLSSGLYTLALAVLPLLTLATSSPSNEIGIKLSLFTFISIFSQSVLADVGIVGGDSVPIQDFEYQISLQENGKHVCGGSILNSQTIITAAHCTNESYMDSLSVRANSSIVQQGGQVVAVAEIIQHPSYNWTTFDYDVSILRLQNNLTQGSTIALADSLPQVQAACNITGWGSTREGGPMSHDLQGTVVNLVNHTECANDYKPKQLPVTDRMVCAAAPGKDSCQGVSGGPLACNDLLVGLVSWGRGCAEKEFPGVYTDLTNSEIKKFIQSVISNRHTQT